MKHPIPLYFAAFASRSEAAHWLKDNCYSCMYFTSFDNGKTPFCKLVKELLFALSKGYISYETAQKIGNNGKDLTQCKLKLSADYNTEPLTRTPDPDTIQAERLTDPNSGQSSDIEYRDETPDPPQRARHNETKKHILKKRKNLKPKPKKPKPKIELKTKSVKKPIRVDSSKFVKS